jgi:hypothetical protein
LGDDRSLPRIDSIECLFKAVVVLSVHIHAAIDLSLQIQVLEPADVVSSGCGVDKEETVADLVQHLVELVAQRLLHCSTALDELLPSFGQQVDIE